MPQSAILRPSLVPCWDPWQLEASLCACGLISGPIGAMQRGLAGAGIGLALALATVCSIYPPPLSLEAHLQNCVCGLVWACTQKRDTSEVSLYHRGLGILICQRFGAKVVSLCKCLFANSCVKCHLPDDHSIRKESNRKPDMQQHVWIAQLCGILDWNTGGSEHTPDPPDCKQDITGPCSWSCQCEKNIDRLVSRKKNRSPQYLDGAFKNMNTNYNSTPLALYLHVMSHRKQSQLHRSAKGELKTNTVQRTVWRKTNYDEEGAVRLSGCSIPLLLFIHCCESDSSSTYSAYLVSICGWYHTFSAAFDVNI